MTTQENNIKLRLFVSCDKMESDTIALQEMVNGGSVYEKSIQIVVKKNNQYYDFKALIYYYPSLINLKNRVKDQTWAWWSIYVEIPIEPEETENRVYIIRSWKKASDTYTCCESKYKNARYLLDIDWVNKTFFSTPPSKDNFKGGVLKNKYEREWTKAPSRTTEVPPVIHNKKEDVPTTPQEDTDLDDTDEYLPLLKLEKDEMFNYEGHILDVETRGTRANSESIYYNVDGIGKYLEMPGIIDTLVCKKSAYIKDVDYKVFDYKRSTKSKNTFLTHIGLVRMLNISGSDLAVKFREWASKILFAAHSGTEEQKKEAAKEVLRGASQEAFDETFRCIKGNIQGIYLLLLGQVKEYKDNVKNYNTFLENSYMYKFGRTSNIARRLKEHQGTNSGYGKHIKLMFFVVVDGEYLSKAEKDGKGTMRSSGQLVQYQNNNDIKADSIQEEVYCLDEKTVKGMDFYFKELYKEYATHSQNDFNDLIKVGDKLQEIETKHREEMEKLEQSSKEEMKQAVKEAEMKQAVKDIEVEMKLKDLSAEQERKSTEQIIKDMKTEQTIEKLKVEHERELFAREREQFAKDNKTRDEQQVSQKVQYESSLEIEKLKMTILKMEIAK